MQKRGFRYKRTMLSILAHSGQIEIEHILIPGVTQFAIHPFWPFMGKAPQRWVGWEITHIESGRALPWVFTSRKAAMDCAREFDRYDWSDYHKRYEKMKGIGWLIGCKYILRDNAFIPDPPRYADYLRTRAEV